MKTELLCLSALAAAASLAASENEYVPMTHIISNHQHCFAPKAFFRWHDETNYKFNTWGLGVEYQLKRPEGINLKLSVITNPQDEKVLVEAENTLYYKHYLDHDLMIYPIFSNKLTNHKIHDFEDHEIYITKHTFFGGFGLDYCANGFTHVRTEIQGFRDMYNGMMIKQDHIFNGKSYSNPFGLRAKLGFTHQFGPDKFVDIEGFYSKTIAHVYQSAGVEVSFKWGF